MPVGSRQASFPSKEKEIRNKRMTQGVKDKLKKVREELSTSENIMEPPSFEDFRA